MSDRDDFGAFLIGFVVGGLAGAMAALLLAPQSGEETRALIKEKSIELRDQAVKQAEIVGEKASQFATDARSRADEFTKEVRTRGTEAVQSVKKAVARKKPAESAGG
jgi:gas vesicle protein